jgi:hypothetical protein
MPAAANGDNLYIGRGKFYFDRYGSNMQPSGVLRFVGEADKGDISISSTNKSRYTTTKATNNKIASVDTQQTHTIAMDLMEFTKENLALALLGDVSTFTQSVTPVTSESLAATHAIGDILQLKGRNPSSLILTGSSGPLALGTDYEIEDQKIGLIRMLTAGTTVSAAYTPGTTALPRIAAGQNTAIYGRLVFVGDPTIGPGFDVEAWKVKFMSAGVLSLLSDDFDKMSLNGEILDDSINHPSAPLYQVTYRDSAS